MKTFFLAPWARSSEVIITDTLDIHTVLKRVIFRLSKCCYSCSHWTSFSFSMSVGILCLLPNFICWLLKMLSQAPPVAHLLSFVSCSLFPYQNPSFTCLIPFILHLSSPSSVVQPANFSAFVLFYWPQDIWTSQVSLFSVVSTDARFSHACLLRILLSSWYALQQDRLTKKHVRAIYVFLTFISHVRDVCYILWALQMFSSTTMILHVCMCITGLSLISG